MNRKNIIFRNVSLGVIYKILNMGIVFTTIPLLLNYLEKEQYGIWVTIFSLVNIVFFVDAGIGNGLKTKLSEALSLRDLKLARTYISTAYIIISSISLIVFCLGVFLIFLINFQDLLNTNIAERELKMLLLTTLSLVIVTFVLNLYKSFYYANQQASKIELAMLLCQATILISIAILIQFFPQKLLYVALIYGVLNITISIIFTILFFKKNKQIKPSFKSFSKEKIKDLMGLSLGFFAIQLCMIIIFATDNLIISNLLGPGEVTNYDIVYKLFQVVITLSVIAQDPLWALYTDAYQKRDYNWIKQTLIRLNRLFILFVLFVFVLLLISKSIIKVWIQRDLLISNSLVLFMAIFVVIRVYGIIYMNFLNSIGRIKLQMKLYIFGAVINLPLSIFFVQQFNLGSSGVILGTILSVVGLSIALPIQTFKILKGK